MTSTFPDDSLENCNSLLLEIEQYAISDPGNKKWQYGLSKCHSRIGNIQFSRGQVTAGTNSILTAINILEQLAKNEPENMSWQNELFRTYEMLGNQLHLQNDLPYAELFYFQSIVIRKKVQGEDHPEYILCLSNLVSLYISMGKREAAETLLKEQLAVYDKMPGKEPPGFTLCLEQLAELYVRKGNYADSQLLYLKAVAVKKKLFGEKHPVYITALNKLNDSYKKTGTLNSVYGDMSKAMQGGQPAKKETNLSAGENVNFAISYPSGMLLSESYVLDVWLFLEEQREKLMGRIKDESGNDMKVKSEGPVIMERGSAVTARLTIENFTIEPAEKSFTWTGDINNTSFIVNVPENTKEGSKIGRVQFYINGLEASRLHFKVNVSSRLNEQVQPEKSIASVTKHKTAFASYASDDRNDVLARVQGLEKAGIDVFLDVRNLRSGEKYEEKLLEKIRDTDVFYLFWSTAAKKSEWVRKEWEYALQKRGIDFINPIPLESPEIAPPPPELSQVLHFGDWTLAYKRAGTIN